MPKIAIETPQTQQNNIEKIGPNGLKPFEPHPPELRKLYAQWVSKPAAERQPPTKQEFAILHGIGYRTVQEWDTDVSFADEIRFHVKSSALQHAGDVSKAIIDSALGLNKDSSGKHAELYLRHLAGIWNDENNLNITIGEKSDSIGALEEGRLAEQLGGILEHLKRAETAIDADYEVLGSDTDAARQPVSHPGTDAASDTGV